MSDLAVELTSVEKVIHHEGSKWILYSHNGSKKLGEFDTEEAAKERERQINYFKHVAKSDLEMEFGKFNSCHDERGKFCSGSMYSRIQAVKALAAKDPRVAESERLIREGGDSRNWPGVREAGLYSSKAHLENTSIAKSFLNPKAVAKEGEAPIAIILLGKPGSGKTTVVRSMGNTVPTTMINSDDIKEKIPGYKANARQIVHERGCDIARNYLAPAAIAARHNITFDMTDNQERVLKMAAELKSKGYKIGVIHVDVDNATSAERVYSRFQHSGVYVPVHVALSYGEKPEKSYQALKSSGLVDQWRKYDNSGHGVPPKQIDAGGKEVFKRGAVGSLGAGFGGGSSGRAASMVEGFDSLREGREEISDLAQEFGKFNPNHDAKGKFASGGGSGSELVPSRGSQDNAIEDIKQELQMVSSFTGGKGQQAFVLEHGKPFYMNDKTFSGLRDPQKECYKNATLKVLGDKDLTYVEGFVHIGPLAIHHAWTADKQGNVVDSTLKLRTGSVSARGYFGVPFTREYVEATARKTKVYGVISHTNRDLLEGKDNLKTVISKFNPNHDHLGRFASGSGTSGAALDLRTRGLGYQEEEAAAFEEGNRLNKADPWYTKITEDEEEAVDDWISTKYSKDWNTHLRTGGNAANPFDPAKAIPAPGGNRGGPEAAYNWRTRRINEMDSVLSRASLPETVAAYRGFGSQASIVANLKPGESFIDNGFVSTTLHSQYAAARFGGDRVLARVIIPKGAHAAYLVGGNEAEILLKRGTTFTMVSKERTTTLFRGVKGLPAREPTTIVTLRASL
jgi:predicted ABC-type ATPase